MYDKIWKTLMLTVGILLSICCNLFPSVYAANVTIDTEPIPSEWIVAWSGPPDPSFAGDSTIVRSYQDGRLVVAKPKGETEAWVRRWSGAPGLRFLEPNQQVQAAAMPNDPLLANQAYLEQIHAQQAWEMETGNTKITIAVVDTGIDLNHPDLKDNLVDGYNLLQPNAPPDDDNGHGTNVAGVIAAVSDNDKGVAGLLWNAKVMPIKALDKDGNGDEDKLGEGIRYAVDHGANIVVLSLGLNKYSAYMSEVVRYAEAHGVLLVAASGNEAGAVKYPAAYPTVLAVGGAAPDGRPAERSNFGPELDVLAPWEVFTTARGGGYENKDGTSLAAPQVAAVSALVWAKEPSLTPAQLRDRIRQTADSSAAGGWSEQTGFGVLRADRALQEATRADMFEPNERMENAKAIPLQKTIDASFSSIDDQDWYRINTSYDGTLTFKLAAPGYTGQVQASLQGNNGVTHTITLQANGLVSESIPVSKGMSYIQLRPVPDADGIAFKQTAYSFSIDYTVYRDAFEDNDRSYKASVLPSRSTRITGTFDHMQDEDWFLFPVKDDGTLRVKVYVDTNRMDPIVSVGKRGQKELVFDQNGDGVTEETFAIDVTPGDYLIKVSNIADYVYPVAGEYTLQIDYRTAISDPNEPNDKPYQATMMRLDTAYEGLLETQSDVDWFRFRLEEAGWVTVTGYSFGEDVTTNLSLQTQELKPIAGSQSVNGLLQWEGELSAGTYDMKITGSDLYDSQPYSIQVYVEPFVSGYRDIAGHWAQASIEKLTKNGIVDGYENRKFEPDSRLTRAEAAQLFDRAFHPAATSRKPAFDDVAEDNWAYPAVARAAAAGWIDGYPDRTFRPNQWVTRAEMAVILSRALGLKIVESAPSFPDTPDTAWYASAIRALQDRGLITGYTDGTFRPEQGMSRAELAALLDRVLYQK